MAQVTDRNIGANPTGFDMRTELNNIIAALESDNSGSSAPLNTVAYMKWLDTSNATYYYMKERNHDNTAWVTLFRYTVATKIMEAVSNGVVLQDSNLVHKTGDETIAGVKTLNNNLVFASGTKIQGDFSNVDLSTTPVFQTNVSNAYTGIYAIPNGTNTTSHFGASSSSDLNNSPILALQANLTDTRVTATRTGTGAWLPLWFTTSGVPHLKIDTSGNVLVTGSGGLGYGTGSGGTVTQLTSKSTAVTLNKPNGQITMNGASLAAWSLAGFQLINSVITSQDNIIVATSSNPTGIYQVWVYQISNGAALIAIKNNSGGALAEAVVISFAIIKGATA